MIRSYEEFQAIVLRWMLRTYGTSPSVNPEVTYQAIRELFDLLSLDEMVRTEQEAVYPEREIKALLVP